MKHLRDLDMAEVQLKSREIRIEEPPLHRFRHLKSGKEFDYH